MPSAASVKIDKQISPENALADSTQNLTPVRQAITVIEHKIRNLEKRKSKLESYKELQNAGKELNADQKTAVAKFNEVINTLDFARDLCKQFLGIAVASEKEAKKLAKKEAAAKYQAELARLREILLVQDALNQMGNENVRDDFLHGRNGAAQLCESDLKLLDDLYPAVTPKHEAGNPTAFTNEVQAAAEHLLAVVDGKPKEVFGGTYTQIKEVLGKIHESGYFDQAQVFETYEEAEPTACDDPEDSSPPVETPSLNNHEAAAAQLPLPEELQLPDPSASLQPLVEPLALDPRPNMLEPQQQQQPATIEQQPPLETILPPEQIYYQPLPQQPMPQVQPPRPISEMLGAGNFFFLQDSEIDPPPEQLPSQIPSQTYTNQTFGPPHPVVPMAPHFGPMPGAPLPQPVPSHQVPPQLPMGNNGIIDDSNLIQPDEKDARGPPRSVNNTNNGSFYQNNGYNNRQRQQTQNRNGARPSANNRHT